MTIASFLAAGASRERRRVTSLFGRAPLGQSWLVWTGAAPPPIGRTAHGWRRSFRRVRVESDPIFIRDGRIYTSAGVTAGMDLTLALIEDDWGRNSVSISRATMCFT